MRYASFLYIPGGHYEARPSVLNFPFRCKTMANEDDISPQIFYKHEYRTVLDDLEGHDFFQPGIITALEVFQYPVSRIAVAILLVLGFICRWWFLCTSV